MTTSPAEPVPAAAPPAAGDEPTTPRTATTAPADAEAAAQPGTGTAETEAAETEAAVTEAAETGNSAGAEGTGGPEEAAAPAPAAPEAKVTDIVAGQGGVLTDEVGVVTGELTLRTELAGRDAVVHVQYKEAEEWYTVTGAKATLTDPADVEAIHTVVVGILNRPEA